MISYPNKAALGAKHAQQFLMRIADLLSHDPLLIVVLGNSFNVEAQYDAEKKIVQYIFRSSKPTNKKIRPSP